MDGLQVTPIDLATTFTIAKNPPKGGRYILFRKDDNPGPSAFDRVQFIGFLRPPYHDFDTDPMGEDLGGWTLADTLLVDVFMDDRADLPVFTVVEVNGKFCRIEQVGGTRVVRGLKGLWLSTTCVRYALERGTLELLS